MASDDFNKTNTSTTLGKSNTSITLGKSERCFRALEGAAFLRWQVAEEVDSFGTTNEPNGLEMVFNIEANDTDPYHKVKGDGFVRVNPELYVAAIGYAQITAPTAVEKMKITAQKAGALLNLPIGGGAIIRPHGAHGNIDYSVASPSNLTSTKQQRPQV